MYDRGDRKEANARGVSLRALREERTRNAYLDYFSDDLENRLRSSIHHARFIELELEETPGATLPLHYVSYPLQGTATSFSSVDQAFAHFRATTYLTHLVKYARIRLARYRRAILSRTHATGVPSLA